MASLNAALATLRRTRLRLADLKGRLGTGFSLDELVPLQSHPKVQGRVRYKMSNPLDDIAAEVGATPGQIALAWLLAHGDDIAPIPGTKRVSRVEENCAADRVELSAEQVDMLTNLTPAAGDHHNEEQMRMIER